MTDAPKRSAPATDARTTRVAFLREGVAKLQAENRTEDEIAMIFGISRFAVRGFDRELNPPVARPAPEKTANRTSDNDWPADAVEKLTGLWLEGHSTPEIGRRTGRSKNSVVGKARRLNLPGRPSPIARGYKGTGLLAQAPPPKRLRQIPLSTLMGEQAVKASREDPKPADVAAAPPPPVRQSAGNKPLGGAAGLAAALASARTAPVEIPKPPVVEPLLQHHPAGSRCQFPLWGHFEPVPSPPKFCDAPAPLGSSWCSKHRAVVFVRVRNQEAFA